LFKQIKKFIFFLFLIISTKYPVSNSYFGVRTTDFLMGINGLMKLKKRSIFSMKQHQR